MIISNEVLEKTLNYLALRPWIEVNEIITNLMHLEHENNNLETNNRDNGEPGDTGAKVGGRSKVCGVSKKNR
jgi:hypothetical protein